jgi:CRP-like cAMP-binding protein
MIEENTSEELLWETLRKLEFLRCVDDEHVKELAKLGDVVDFPEGTVVFNEGEPASHCYLILDGKVLLEMCGPGGCARILTIGAGEILGWSALLGKAELTAAARTLTATRAIELSCGDVLALCEHIPSLGYQLMRCTALALAKRLTATRLQLLDLYGE